MAPDVASALAQLGGRENWVGDDDLVFAGELGGYLDGSALRRRYKEALGRALELLQTAKLADRTADGWLVAWEELRVPGEKDLAHALATRACRPPSRSASRRLADAAQAEAAKPSPPPSLF